MATDRRINVISCFSANIQTQTDAVMLGCSYLPLYTVTQDIVISLIYSNTSPDHPDQPNDTTIGLNKYLLLPMMESSDKTGGC